MGKNSLKLTCRGKTLTVAEWEAVSHTPKNTIYQRIARGWPVEEAIFAPQRGAYRESLVKTAKTCRGCYHYKPFYWETNTQQWYCDYIGDTWEKRPCPPGPGCTCYTRTGPKRKKMEDFEV